MRGTKALREEYINKCDQKITICQQISGFHMGHTLNESSKMENMTFREYTNT